MGFNFKIDLDKRESTKEEKTLCKILACLYTEENKDKIGDAQMLFELAIELIHNGFLVAQVIAEQDDEWKKGFYAYLRNFEEGYQEYETTHGVDVPINSEFKA